MPSVWNEQRIELLKEGITLGISFSLLAEKISKETDTRISRDAAIGKAFRLGLCQPMKDRVNHGGNDSALARAFKRSPELYINHRTGGIAKRGEAAKKRLLVRQFRETQPDPFIGVTLLDLEPHHCRYPHGGDDGNPITFCGQDKVVGSYCGYHAALCLTPNEKPKPEEKPRVNFNYIKSVRVA